MTDNPPINWQKGVQFYGGDEDMFKLMVESYENLPFNTHIKLLYEHILTLDFQAIKTDARTIKGVSAFIAAERCQQYAQEVENHATEENENKVIENYMLLLKESKALKTYIASVTKRQLNVGDFEKYEKELKKKYKSMTSSYSSKDSFNKELKKEPVPTKKSLYAELNKEEVGENQIPHQEQEEVSQDDQKCDLEPMNPQKPSPVCCNQCNIF